MATEWIILLFYHCEIF